MGTALRAVACLSAISMARAMWMYHPPHFAPHYPAAPGFVNPWAAPMWNPWMGYPVNFLQLYQDPAGAGGAPVGPDAYEYYFTHDHWGRLVTSPRGVRPEHTHKWMAEIDGITDEERRRNSAFITGAPVGVKGSNNVEPCESFPFCNYVPPPPPLVPAPYRLAAPVPSPTFPVLGMPPRMPWHPPAKGLGLSSGPLIPKAPENMVREQHSLAPKDETEFKQSLQRP